VLDLLRSEWLLIKTSSVAGLTVEIELR